MKPRTTDPQRRHTRCPNGVSHRGVLVRFMPEELSQLRLDAAKEDISLAALVRRRYLAGRTSEQAKV
ncbi:hypothetical protein [Alloalcanivorax xenomutans]|uniref:hypothetical protein n=1 Tax=Alloalcanivorax xenomutans TaxID=1094342 RepID=UPI003C405949